MRVLLVVSSVNQQANFSAGSVPLRRSLRLHGGADGTIWISPDSAADEEAHGGDDAAWRPGAPRGSLLGADARGCGAAGPAYGAGPGADRAGRRAPRERRARTGRA